MSLLWWTLISFLVATVGGVLGFTNVASGASKVTIRKRGVTPVKSKT